MAERAPRLMSADEFLAWDDGTDTRYELIDGVPVAMAPRSVDHMRISGNLFALLETALLERRPCRAIPQAGINLAEGPPGRHYVPDVVMTCEPVTSSKTIEAPQLVVEVLSPSTQSYDKRFKLPVYAGLPSIQELWFVDSRARLVQVWYRLENGWHDGIPIIGQGSFMSRVLGIEVSLDAIYALTSLEAVSAEDGAQDPGTHHP